MQHPQLLDVAWRQQWADKDTNPEECLHLGLAHPDRQHLLLHQGHDQGQQPARGAVSSGDLSGTPPLGDL